MSRFRPSRNYVSGKVVFDGGPVDISGDLVVSGSVTANEYNVNVINTNVTHIDMDGSTKFGDTPDDTHVFTGSVFIDGPLSASSIVGGGATTPGAPVNSVQFNDAGAFAGDADFTWDNAANVLTVTGDITASVNISGAFFYGDGSGLTGVTATAAPAGLNTEIQYNADGILGSDADFTWSSGSNTLSVNGSITSSAILISSSGDPGPLLAVCGNDFPCLLSVDASSSIDGGGRVLIRTSNDDIELPTFTAQRGALHLEQESTSSAALNANGISMYTYAQEQYQSSIRLHTWDPVPGGASHLSFFTNEGTFPRRGFVLDNQRLGRINFGGYDGNQSAFGCYIQARADEDWHFSSKNGTDLQFYLVPKEKGYSPNLRERIRMTGEGHLIVFPYSASNDDADLIQNNFLSSPGSPALQVYGPTIFGSSSLNTHTFTGSVNISGDLSASLNMSASAFYGDGSNLTNVNASLLVGNSLFVDSVNGDDGTATRGNESLPYLTIAAALADSLSGDAIYVGPGDYPETSLSLTTGRALFAPAGYSQTSIGITSSATDIIAAVDNTWIEGFTIHVPTGSGNAGIRYTGTGGTMLAYSMAYSGDGASGLGDGFVKTGTGKVVGAEVRLAKGGLNSMIRVDQGVMAFESIHVPGATGVIENVAIAEGTGRAQLINFNVGNPNVVDTMTVSGSATAICLNVNWFNVANGINLLQDGVTLEVNGGKVQPTTYSIKMDLATTWTTATGITLTNVSLIPTYYVPPTAFSSNFEAFYSQKKGEDYAGAVRLLGVDFVAGLPEKGSGIMAGRGASFGLNTKVYTSDGTDTSTTVGAVIDVTPTASSMEDSTFTFQGGAVDHCIYYGTIRRTPDSQLVKNFGTLIDTTAGSLTGSYVFEIWDGAAWADVDYMCTSVDEGYRYANNPFMRPSSREFIRTGVTPETTWATSSIDGIDAYWSRCRITTSASLPTFERWWLTPSHFMVSTEGVRQSHGSAAWKETLVGAGNIFGESGGVVTANPAVGSGVVPNAWNHNMPNSLLNSPGGDAIYTQFALPAGIDTSFPLTFKVLYSLDDSSPAVDFPTGILSAIPFGVTGIAIADPTGGKIPTARQFDNTETLTSKAAPLALSSSMQPPGAVLGDDLSNKIFSIEYSSLSIEEYYEDDIIAIRFELDDDGDPAYNVAIWAVIVEGHKFTDGKAI